MGCTGIRDGKGSGPRWWALVVAVALLVGVSAAEEPTPNSGLTGRALLRRADGLLNAGRASEAEVLLSQAVALGQADVETLLRLGIAQSVQQKFSQSEATLERAVELAPEEPRVLHNLGLLYLRQERYDKALDYFQRSLRVRPWHPQSNFYIGVIHERRGEPEEALRYYIRELNVNPANPSAWRQYIQLRDAPRRTDGGGFPWDMLLIWLLVVAAAGALYWLKRVYWDGGESPGFSAELEDR